MSKTLVSNVSLGPYTFPMPYQGVLPAGSLGVVDTAPAALAAELGDTTGVLRLEEVPATVPTTIAKVAASNLPDGSVGTAELADLAVTTGKLAALAVTTAKVAAGAVTKAKAAVFVSAPIVGTGVQIATPHGLGAVPSVVMIALVGGPAAVYSQPVIVEGAHTNVNILATVTADWSYQIFAWA